MQLCMPEHMNNNDLLLAYGISKDNSYFATLHARMSAYVGGIVRRYVIGHPVEADDVVQEIWLRVCETYYHYEAGRSAEAWITGVATRTCFLMIRDARAKQRYRSDTTSLEELDLLGVQVPVDCDPQEAAERREKLVMVQRAVAELPDVERQAIEGLYLRGLTQEELSAELDIPRGTLIDRMMNGLERLAVRLAPQLRN